MVAHSHGRRHVEFIDVPLLRTRGAVDLARRTWRCAERMCPTKSFTEQDENLAGHEHASVAGLARQLGTTWRTVWSATRLNRYSSQCHITCFYATSGDAGLLCQK